MAARSKTVGKIGFTPVRRAAAATVTKAAPKVKNPKRDLVEKYGLPKEFETLSTLQLLDIVYEIEDGEKVIKEGDEEIVERKTTQDVLKEIKKNDKIDLGVGVNRKLDYYRGLQARKEFEQFYLEYQPKAEVKLDFKCRFCGNLGANLLPPRYKSPDEPPLVLVQCLGCQKLQAP